MYLRWGAEAAQLRSLFHYVGAQGYGQDAGIGRGPFKAEVQEATSSGLLDGAGNRHMSLSHGSLSESMATPRYRVETHYGKTGAIFTASEPPFKRPLVLLRPGATFAPRGDGPSGALPRDVHPFRPEIVHNVWRRSVPYTEVEAHDA